MARLEPIKQIAKKGDDKLAKFLNEIETLGGEPKTKVDAPNLEGQIVDVEAGIPIKNRLADALGIPAKVEKSPEEKKAAIDAALKRRSFAAPATAFGAATALTASSLDKEPKVEKPTDPIPLVEAINKPQEQNKFVSKVKEDIKKTGGVNVTGLGDTPGEAKKKEEPKEPQPPPPVVDLRDRLIEKKYELMRDYRDLRSRKEWAQVAELFAKALTGYAAAREGLRKGVDLSNIKSEGVNWEEQAKQDLSELDALLKDVRADQASIAAAAEARAARDFRKTEKQDERKWREDQAELDRQTRRDIANISASARRQGRGASKDKEDTLTKYQETQMLARIQAQNERQWLDTNKKLDEILAPVAKAESEMWSSGKSVRDAKQGITDAANSLITLVPGDEEARIAYDAILKARDEKIGVAGRDDYSVIQKNLDILRDKARQRATSIDTAKQELSNMGYTTSAPQTPDAPSVAPEASKPTDPALAPLGEIRIKDGTKVMKVKGGWIEVK